MPAWMMRCLYGVEVMVALMILLFFPAPLFLPLLAFVLLAACLSAHFFAVEYGFLSVVRSVCRIE